MEVVPTVTNHQVCEGGDFLGNGSFVQEVSGSKALFALGCIVACVGRDGNKLVVIIRLGMLWSGQISARGCAAVGAMDTSQLA